MRVCAEPGCPNLIPAKQGNRCKQHRAERERLRGTRQQRGYDYRHDQLRSRWAPRVAAGAVKCWRCGELIAPDEPWDLGHDDNDRTKYRGPEHAFRCNRSAAGRKSHEQ